jgi:two-component system, chemotaxis family, sensor kinase CheA
MSGTIGLETTPGRGAKFILRLPLTLTILNVMLVRSGSQRFAVPVHMVDEAVEINPGEIITIEDGELYNFREQPLAVFRLGRIFGIPVDPKKNFLYGLITGEKDHRSILVVDQLYGLREVVVRLIKDPLVDQVGVFGATELGDGRVILILDVPELINDRSMQEHLQR